MGRVGLIKLLPEEREFLIKKVAHRHPVPQAVAALHLEFPESYEYSITAYRKYLASEEGKNAVQAETEVLREEAKEHSFAVRESRVAVLVELAEKLLNKLRRTEDQEVGNRPYVLLSQEFRATLGDLRKEMEVFGIDASMGVDFFANLMQTVGNMKKEEKNMDFLRDALEAGGPVIITQDTANDN